ncbi:MAG: sugar ABC transporter permease [Bacilli bacterium]|nr:sugar ABC transporter permease [Bacilli bacterium]
MSNNNKNQEESVESLTQPEGGAIDFGSINALANSGWTKEPWWKKLLVWLAETLIRILLFVFGIIFDVCRAIVNIIVTIVHFFTRGCPAIGRFFRDKGRIWREGDKWVKLSFFVNGIGFIPTKQYFNAVLYMLAELAFIVYMAVVGVKGIIDFILLGNVGHGYPDANPQAGGMAQNMSIQFMIIGIVTFMIIGLYVFCYFKAVRGAYDMYLIEHMNEYKQSFKDAEYVLENPDHFEEDLSKMSCKKIYELMRTKYGYGIPSARQISYVEWKRVADREPNGVQRFFKGIADWFYRGYDKVRNGIAASPWSTVFAKWLFWEQKQPEITSGRNYVLAVQKGKEARFHHTYDKFNDYLPWVREQKVVLNVLADPRKLLDCAYCRDEVSQRNGIEALPDGAKLKYRSVATRVVGLFECELHVANRVGKWVVTAVQNEAVTSRKGAPVKAEQYLANIRDGLRDKYNQFVSVNHDQRLARCEKFANLYLEENRPSVVDTLPLGKKGFIEHFMSEEKLDESQAKQLYEDFAYGNTLGAEEAEAFYTLRNQRAAAVLETEKTYPLHPAPLSAKKQLMQFTDEKFHITVLALPTLGAVLTCIIPLLFSIFLAFTNFDGDHAYNNFDWANLGFAKLFSTGTGGLMKSFLSLFVWTMVWAFFATFLNYIFGIVVSLLINKKGIKFKGLWRTMFVISIAVPQFITLLAMKILLSDTGAINAWLASGSTATMTGTGTLEDPYVISGNGGFLEWLSGWCDSSGRSIVTATVRALQGKYLRTDSGEVIQLTQTINVYTKDAYIGFLSNLNTFSTNNSTFAAMAIIPKITIILVNCWVGIPYTILQTSGILMNIPEDLYESARIDGANAWTQFWKITMPYVLFVTGPSLLTTFIGNINNFNVIYFLTGGGPTTGGVLNSASKAEGTDLLITWLYKITVTSEKHQYYLASSIGCVIFLVCAFFSLIMYSRMGSVKNEEEFQ